LDEAAAPREGGAVCRGYSALGVLDREDGSGV